ncbi:MAG: hypothetical protein IKU26_04465 [Clostridia bacterium]|nr:hypothetical protein [Clostridia bacterium]
MSNKNNNLGCLYSWPVIIIALICFWPVGLFLIIKRASVDKKTAMASGKLIKGLGIASCCMAALGFLVCLSDGFDGTDVGMIIFFAAAGAALLYLANKIKKDADSVKLYLNIIVNGGERQLDSVAAATGKQYDVVKKDVQKMIDKGFLKNAYINENTREVVLPSAAPANVNVAQPTGGTAPAAAQTRVIACPCCGANNTISGDIGECEYCGTPLK